MFHASVQRAAQECLPYLIEMEQRETEARTLLRGSAAVEPTTLLRPVTEAAIELERNAHPEELLRAAATEGQH